MRDINDASDMKSYLRNNLRMNVSNETVETALRIYEMCGGLDDAVIAITDLCLYAITDAEMHNTGASEDI